MHDRYKIVGTAGHIDHGKSALVRALTGTDPDRLQEERERGITIDLGFAHLELDDGTRVGFIDVPGHERFVKNMLAGIGGIDTVLMVVAADESIMPQTREHLAICELLEITGGVVAITKCDLVDEEIAELVELEVREELLAGTRLEGAPVVRTSAQSGAGLDELRVALQAALQGADERSTGGYTRLPIDRVFTMRGFGTVVTGTLLSGTISPGDKLEIMPQATPVTVRGVQVYGQAVPAATPGQRTAVNLQGIDVDALARGDVLASPGALAPTYMLDARLRMLPGHGLEHLQRVRFHHGAAEILARVALLDGDAVAPGDSAPVQLRLESTYACVPGDRFVIRRYSPMLTIGGGVVLDNQPVKHRPSDGAARALVQRLETASDEQRLAALLGAAGDAGVGERDLQQRMFMQPAALQQLADRLAARDEILVARRNPLLLLDAGAAQRLADLVVATLEAHHHDNPLADAVPKSALTAALPAHLPEAALDALLRRMVDQERIRETAAGVALPEHRVELTGEQERARSELLRLFEDAGWAPPSVEEAFERCGVAPDIADAVLHMMLRSGELVRVRNELVFRTTRLEALVDELRQRYAAGETFSVPDFKEWTGVSRKHAIPLLEHLDEQRVTRRDGDRRVRL